MRRALAVVLFAPWAASGQTCAALDGATRLESERFVVAMHTVPDRIEVGKHFTLELTVCAKAGKSPESVQVDAHMPAHRHGMNYTARVVPSPGGAYRAQGLLFHMPGRWEIVVDLRRDGKGDRVVQPVTLE
jgi:hypothetical protein